MFGSLVILLEKMTWDNKHSLLFGEIRRETQNNSAKIDVSAPCGTLKWSASLPKFSSRAQTFIPYWIFWLVLRISPKISDCSYYNTILNRFNKTTPNVSRITRPRNENIKWNLSVEPKLALTFDTNSKSSFDICSALWLLRVTGFSFLPAVWRIWILTLEYKGLIKIIVACSRRSVSKTKCDSK